MNIKPSPYAAEVNAVQLLHQDSDILKLLGHIKGVLLAAESRTPDLDDLLGEYKRYDSLCVAVVFTRKEIFDYLAFEKGYINHTAYATFSMSEVLGDACSSLTDTYRIQALHEASEQVFTGEFD